MIPKRYTLALSLAAASLCIAPLACGGGGDKGGDAKAKKDDKKDDKKGEKKDEKKAAKKGDYEGGAVEGGGSIAGTITYTGDQKAGTVNVTKDEGTCIHGGKPDADIAVGEGGVLANAVVYIDGIKAGKAHDPQPTEVDNKECVFNPRVSIGYTGSEIAAKNSDNVLHNTHLYLQEGNKNLVNIALPQQGQVINKKLKKPGIVDIKCDAHEWMQGWMYVSEHPYATVTGADGKFDLGDVPAGEHKVKIWHEKLGEHEATVKVDAGGAATVDHAFS